MTDKNYTIEKLKFEIIDCDDKTCSINFETKNGNAFSKERRKLYIIDDGKLILYVDEANCSIKERFRRVL